MRPEQQRIKIAEACGWKRHPLQMNKNFWIHFPSEKQARDDNDLPDFLNNLNAMHEAEKLLRAKDELWGEYCGHLVKNGSWFNAVDATAAQRAEAFLKTLNLWEES
jgi:hypothetical protein